jgi:peptidoglycan/LPS O-acetylase OafA/YrhL
MFAYGRDDPYPGWRALAPTVGTLLVLAAGSRAWLNRTVLAHPALVFIGWISYPLYLWHWPLLYLTRISAVTTPSPVIRSLAMLVAVGLAWLTYRFLERPIRRNSGARSVIALLVIAAGLGALGVATWYGVGPRPRLDYLTAELAEFAPMREDSGSTSACTKLIPFPRTTVVSSPSAGLRRLC